MVEYLNPINISDYAYMETIYVTDNGNGDKRNVQIKLELDSSNFNFSYANIDGSDIRLSLNSNGTGVLPIWVQSWDYVNSTAVIWFKLPLLYENEVKKIYVFWGNSLSEVVSDIDNLEFLLADSFEDTSLTGVSYTKWLNWPITFMTRGDSFININGVGASASYLTYVGTPLVGNSSWYMEMNATLAGDSSSYIGNYFSFYLLGTENPIGATYIKSYVNHNIEDSSVYVDYSTDLYGFTLNKPTTMSLYYYEPTDICTHSMSYGSSVVNIERIGNGNTRLTTLRLYGGTSGSISINIYDVLVKKYYGPYEPSINTDNLYVEYQNIEAPSDDGIQYNLIAVGELWKYSSLGGSVDNLFDGNIYTNWVSDSTTTYSGSVYIDMIAGNLNLTKDTDVAGYFESSYIGFLNARKLSDNDYDPNNNNYWLCTTSSGYAGISFSSPKSVGSFRIKAVSDLMTGCPKDYKLYGGIFSNIIDPFSNKTLLMEGTFLNTSELQTCYFNNYMSYDYYYLDVLNTYGDDPVAIQEWYLFDNSNIGGRIVSKIGLKVSEYSDYYKYFVRRIKLYGTNDMVNWSLLLPETYTYTPLNRSWQFFTFSNNTAYNMYKIVLSGNWADSEGNKLVISDIELYSKVVDDHTYFVLKGDSNSFDTIQGLGDNFDLCSFYVTNNILSAVYNNALAYYTTLDSNAIDIDT